jgi:hypothetical protein
MDAINGKKITNIILATGADILKYQDEGFVPKGAPVLVILKGRDSEGNEFIKQSSIQQAMYKYGDI